MIPFFTILLVVVVLYALFGRQGRDQEDSALDILKKRYARGEISQAEFERIKKDLLG